MWNQRHSFVVLAVTVLVAGQAQAADDDDDDVPRSCYKYTTDFLKSSTITLLKCLGEKFKPKSLGEYLTRAWCILKCVLQELGSIDPEGKFDDIAAAFFFEANFAPEVQEGLLPNVQGCFALADQFDNKDYFCKTYEPFISCVLKALIAQLLPYSLNCYVSPGIAIVLDVLKHIAPDPILQNDAQEVRRRLSKPKPIHCYNKDCTRMYKIQKSNGTATFILYDRNMTEITRSLRKPVITMS